jgi:hypothetical protein
MNTTLQLRWGDTIDNPTTQQLLSALADLDTEDDEHPDTWLICHINGKDWSVLAFGRGLTILSIWNYETDPETVEEFEMFDVPRDQVLKMWHEMQRGELHKIEARPWKLRP